MIPKIIHYCWFGKGLMPKSQKDCIKSWKKVMPDYKIMRWDETNFNVEKYSAAKYAHKVKKYALVSDICRYNVLYEYGGIYLDTDVKVFKPFDDYLDVDFFSAIELYNEFYTENSTELLEGNANPKIPGAEIPHLEILTSTMGCTPRNEMIGQLCDFYNNIKADEEYAINYRKYVNNDRLVASFATKYGFRYIDEKQMLDNNMVIYPTGIFGHAFCLNKKFEVSYHYNATSWDKDSLNYHNSQFDKYHLLGLYKKFRTLKTLFKKLLGNGK